jgi:hypothetical protein
LIVQDRTPEDCLLPGSREHLRGYFFEKFPRLAEVETKRRHESAEVQEALAGAGFVDVEEFTIWETRRVYGSPEELREDLLARTGRSLLHDLTDEELLELVRYVEEQVGRDQGEIVEKDRWTIWVARKGG